MRRSWYLLLAIGLLAGLCAVPGCRPEVPKSELGEILDHVPDLKGMDQPYKLRYVPPIPKSTQMGGQPMAPKTETEANKEAEATNDSATKK